MHSIISRLQFKDMCYNYYINITLMRHHLPIFILSNNYFLFSNLCLPLSYPQCSLCILSNRVLFPVYFYLVSVPWLIFYFLPRSFDSNPSLSQLYIFCVILVPPQVFISHSPSLPFFFHFCCPTQFSPSVNYSFFFLDCPLLFFLLSIILLGLLNTLF